MLAAGDTFRAGAIQQLNVWGERVGVEVVSQNEGSDPAAVVYDAINAAKNKDVDILICDTAGRLQNKSNLMQELDKMKRVINRAIPDAPMKLYYVWMQQLVKMHFHKHVHLRKLQMSQV